MSSYDTLIIGGGLTGLFLAHRLHHGGQKVGLYEARETLGGRSRRQSVAQPYSSPGLEFYPATNENLELLEWMKSVSPIPLNFEVREHRPELYDEGRWRAFAGFGNTEFQSVGELAHYSHTHEVAIDPGMEHVVRALVEQLPFEADLRSEITNIKLADGKVSEVIVNGDKTVKAERVIFTPEAALLNNLVEGEGLNAKHRTRLAKMQPWTAVVLELKHTPPLVEDSSIRVFTHGSKEFEPVVGRAFGETSKWMTLVPGERALEHEFIGQVIRHIKRQMKRAWPERLEGVMQEKISVQIAAFGQQQLKTKDNVRFPEISNLYVANHLLANRVGEISSIEMVREIENAILGGQSAVKSTRESESWD